MMFPNVLRNHARGIAIMEVVVAVSLLVTVSVGVFIAARYTLAAQRGEMLHRRAVLLSEEALAVARLERDGDWATFSGRPLDTLLYPTFTATSAELSQTDPGSIDGIFTSTVTLDGVYRDNNGDIDPMGSTLDDDARFVEARVSWTDAIGRNREIVLSTYLMNL